MFPATRDRSLKNRDAPVSTACRDYYEMLEGRDVASLF